MSFSVRGTGVALVTPFRNGEVDYDGLRRLIEHCITGGVEYLVSLGTTGESAVLTKEEKFKVLDFTINTIGGRVGLVAGFGGNDTNAVIRDIQAYHFNGVDAILCVSPAYNKPTQEGIFQHFMAIQSIAPRPIILYNVPGRTSSNMTAETTIRLAQASPKFIAVKEASGNFRQCMEIVYRKPDRFKLLSGDDNITLPLIACGAEGVISVVANALPSNFSDMVRTALEGKYDLAQKQHYQLLHFIDNLFEQGNPAGVKAALQVLGVCSQELRLPLVPVDQSLYETIRQQLDIIPVGNATQA